MNLQDWSDAELLEELDEEGAGLTPWEVEFVASLVDAARSSPLSEAQRRKLIQVVEQRCDLEGAE